MTMHAQKVPVLRRALIEVLLVQSINAGRSETQGDDTFPGSL
jgi:hypothetical protein